MAGVRIPMVWLMDPVAISLVMTLDIGAGACSGHVPEV